MDTALLAYLQEIQGVEITAPPSEMFVYMKLFLVTIGWAITGGVGMGLGLIIALKIFTLMTHKVDEWELIKQGNIPIAIIMGAVVLGTSLVIMMCVKPSL